ncbi:uncharacterized protein LOC111333558 [Stylophora pistillata]|uniref:uncharacterized protein LOC111333558 n=1 Tax=Stylophora pistillata TaxID=50429 RepID=UPI000C056751|nr:uncharacterized protein LOC111333558 [Stylophora pistillata]
MWYTDIFGASARRFKSAKKQTAQNYLSLRGRKYFAIITALMTCSGEVRNRPPLTKFIKRRSLMAASICQSLINEGWKSYANDLGEAPEAKGIYTIGLEGEGISTWVIQTTFEGGSRNTKTKI